jgi:predicted kinase
VLFDCLEFSEELGTVDVLYDLAFLIMDILERGYAHAAWRLDQAYGELTEDDEGKALLPLFLAVRATVRAKIQGFSARVLAGEQASAARRRAADYLKLARQALEPAPARLIAVGGRSGTGKSSLAASLAPQLLPLPGATVLRSDVVRKRLLGRQPTDRLPAEAYTDQVSERVFARMAERAAVLLKAGRCVVVDGTYGDPAHRRAIETVAKRHGVPFTAFWLNAPEKLLVERVTARKGDASDATAGVVLRQQGLESCPEGWFPLHAGRPLEEVSTEAAVILAQEC